MSKGKEIIGFEAFSSFSYQAVGAYAGMDWTSMDTMGAGFLAELGYCDSGYNNTIQGHCEAFTSPFSDGYGIMETQNLKDPFTLKSMIAASAWCGTQDFVFNSYEASGNSVVLKASDTILLSQTGQKIDFAHYHNDFKNIVAINILSTTDWTSGSTCTYGWGIYGYQMAFDKVSVKFRHGIPTHHKGDHQFLLPAQLRHHQHFGSAVGHAGSYGGSAHNGSGHGGGGAGHNTADAYHTQLLALDHGSGGLTAQFHLPAVEHFGS